MHNPENCQTVEIDLGDRSYPIHIGPDLFTDTELLRAHINGKQVAIVTNSTVEPLYANTIRQQLDGYATITVTLKDGEAYKNLDSLNDIISDMLTARFDRTCTILALGGGVVGDLAGFAAATYQRGVNFIQLPTTLLAQVDSSVGGKTGVNHPQGKNMIGAFHQPRCVIADTNTITTLPANELRAGLAEVIKHGFILDESFFTWLEQNTQKLLEKDPVALTHAIRRSCEIKAEVVARDEQEHGVRALLNLGHTFGHAIEAALGYGNWLHGEAVAAGIAMASDLSCRLGLIDATSHRRGLALLQAAGLPIRAPAEITPEQFMHYMTRDKKTRDGQIRLILLNAIGSAIVSDDFDSTVLQQLLEHHQAA